MKNNDQVMTYLSEHSFSIDELGRVVIDDPNILAEINGAFSPGDALAHALSNGACANGSCH